MAEANTDLGGPMDIDDDNYAEIMNADDPDYEQRRKRAPRCSKCRRMTRGHEGPYGNKCSNSILNTEELKNDDIKKIDESKAKEASKRTASTELKELAKKHKQETEKKEEEKARKELENKKKEIEIEKDKAKRAKQESEKMDEKLKKQKEERIQIENENRRRAKQLHEETHKTAQAYRETGAKYKDTHPNQRQKSREKYYTDSPRRTYRERRRRKETISPRMQRHQESTPRKNSSRRMENRSPGNRNSRRSEEEERNGRRDARSSCSKRSDASRRMDEERSTSGSRRMDEFTSSMFQAFSRVNENDDKKIDPVPMWEESTSFEGWKKEIMIWSRARGRPERKTQLLVEHLKKDTIRKGLKEMVINEFVENEAFQFENPDAIKIILEQIKEFIDETKWNKTIKLVKDFGEMKQGESENNKEFITRFSMMETRMKNAGSLLPGRWLAAELVSKSRMNHLQKHNILATVDTEENPNILKDIKKKMKDLDGCSNDETKKTFYAENRNFSRDRNRKWEENRRNRGTSGDRRDRSYSRNRSYKNRSCSKGRDSGRRSQSRGNQKTSEGFQEAGKPVPPSPKRTYHVTLKIDNQKSIFENEVVNKALVDSGCPELVAGLSWLKTYQSSRCREFRNLNRSDTFQMGETIFKTICYKLIPVKIGNHEEELEVGIIDAEIPLLISKRKLKEWG